MKALQTIAMLALSMTTIPAAAESTAPQMLEQSLRTALADEYHAEAFYAAVIDHFGNVRPFSNIIRSERMHQAMIIDLMKAHGFAVPANDQLGSATILAAVPARLSEACTIGVKAEIDNRDLYEAKLLPAVVAYPDVVATFERLSAASDSNHLPAFERCAN
jgi:hypothetical protein